MIKRVLVPLDGSKLAEQAIPVAARIARATGGSVIFLRVITEATDFYLLSVAASQGAQDVIARRQDEVKRYLAQLASSEVLEGVETVTEAIEGSPAETILSAANSHQADLILMSSHGYTGFKRWMLGSVAHKVAWHSTTPVLILRESSHPLTSLSPKVGHPIRVLVALDGTPFTEAALLPAAQLVAALSAPARGELHLTHLIKLVSTQEEMAYEQLGIDVDLRRAALYRADHYLQAIKERLSSEIPAEAAVDITWSVEECTDVAESLLNIAQGEGEGTHAASDLIALTTHGRSHLDQWVKGSVAERILSSATMPLLVVHPHQLAHSLGSVTSESKDVALP